MKEFKIGITFLTVLGVLYFTIVNTSFTDISEPINLTYDVKDKEIKHIVVETGAIATDVFSDPGVWTIAHGLVDVMCTAIPDQALNTSQYQGALFYRPHQPSAERDAANALSLRPASTTMNKAQCANKV